MLILFKNFPEFIIILIITSFTMSACSIFVTIKKILSDAIKYILKIYFYFPPCTECFFWIPFITWLASALPSWSAVNIPEWDNNMLIASPVWLSRLCMLVVLFSAAQFKNPAISSEDPDMFPSVGLFSGARADFLSFISWIIGLGLGNRNITSTA